MPNTYTGFFQTLLAAAEEASNALVFNTPFLDSVYTDYKPEPMQPYGTLDVVVPNSTSNITDIGSGSLTYRDVNSSTKALTFSNHPADGFTVPSWDQLRTPADIRRLFLDEAIKRAVEYLDNAIAALCTTANFNVCSTVSGSGGTISAANMGSAWKELVAQRCPVRDFGNFFLMTHQDVYSALLQDTTYWTPNSQVGYQIATTVRRQALLGQQWGAFADYDPNMPKPSVGSPPATVYNSILFHRWAIALAIRPLPPPSHPAAQSVTMFYRGIPFRVIVSWLPNNIAEGISIDFGYALGVVRPELGVIIQS